MIMINDVYSRLVFWIKISLLPQNLASFYRDSHQETGPILNIRDLSTFFGAQFFKKGILFASIP